METIMYFQLNDWNAHKCMRRLIKCYLEGSIYIDCNPDEFSEGIVCKTPDEEIKWVEDNKLCINCDIYDQSQQYWVTTTKEWLMENFPEILEEASENPKDFIFKGDRKFYLKYMPENVGYNFATTENYDDEVPVYLAAGRYAFPELFEDKK